MEEKFYPILALERLDARNLTQRGKGTPGTWKRKDETPDELALFFLDSEKQQQAPTQVVILPPITWSLKHTAIQGVPLATETRQRTNNHWPFYGSPVKTGKTNVLIGLDTENQAYRGTNFRLRSSTHNPTQG
jgi:hypothetical protein